ncbi:MAG TPA: SLBB domain-containing protein [Acidobacteriaceae bacterium]
MLLSARLPLRFPRSLFRLSAAVVLAGVTLTCVRQAQAQNPNTTDTTDTQNQNPPAGSLPTPANTFPSTMQSSPVVPESEATRAARLERESEGTREAQEMDTISGNRQVLLPPEPPTPFQQMVRATTGQRLEIYGASLFQRVPTTFAPVQNVPVGPGYILGPGDELEIQISGQVNRQLSVVVDRTGSIALPELGMVHVAGLPYGQLNSFLNAQLGKIYRNFTVSATMGALRTIQVFVVGQARRPGSFSVSSLSTLLNALFASGGPLPTGSVRDIQVKRGGETIDHFDLYDLLLHGDKSHDIALATGDVIFIPFAGPQVAVTGSVNHPAIYELKNETTVAQTLALAGGEDSAASDGNVLLERVYQHTERNVESVSLAQTETTTVQGGDILSVRSVIDRFRNAVTLRGNVANPGRYAWRPGMRVSDLIPNRESLITRDYWRRRNQLGQFVLQQSEESESEARRQAQGTETPGMQQRQNTQSPTTQQNMQAQTGQIQGGQTQGAQSGGQTAQQNEGALEMNGNTEASANQRQQGNGNSSSQGGNAVGGALIDGAGRFQPKNDVVLSAPDIDWSYAVIERQDAKTLTTSLIPFNLGKIVLEGDTSQDLELLPGDVVTIFSKADIRVPSVQQTRYVRLEGEFVGAGVYSVQPGETLRGLLRRAGGFTPDAYLYASEFTRESTRRVEQQRLNEYADQLEAQVASATASNQARAGSAMEQASDAASQAAAQAAVARLRRLRPVGRIVLDLTPDSAGIDSVPDIALEDGDRFVVPRVPSNVNVEGQVYSANAFVYRPGKRALDYLRKAGGPDRQADRRRMFILRADGSVVSRQYANVMKAMIYPGDTIVVPPALDRRSILQRTTDIAQIVGNFALSIAALDVLAHQ